MIRYGDAVSFSIVLLNFNLFLCILRMIYLEDHEEHLKYSQDPDAKVGHKTADSSFFGYKTKQLGNQKIS